MFTYASFALRIRCLMINHVMLCFLLLFNDSCCVWHSLVLLLLLLLLLLLHYVPTGNTDRDSLLGCASRGWMFLAGD
jgi:hypothetical protein